MKKFTLTHAKKIIPTRPHRGNKHDGGKALLIAGSPTLQGAAVLAALAAARTGAGYVYLLQKESTRFVLKHPEFLNQPKWPKNWNIYQAVAAGPGARFSVKTPLRSLIVKAKVPIVLDAEALRWLAKNQGLAPLRANCILTPHEGEMAPLIGRSIQWVKKHRTQAVIEAQKKWGCVVVLKGAPTLVADKNGLWQNTSGNPALAKAGTGDVLTGIILGFLSQGLSCSEAALLAVLLHGGMADRWVKSGKDPLSLLPSDLLADLPYALAGLRQGRFL